MCPTGWYYTDIKTLNFESLRPWTAPSTVYIEAKKVLAEAKKAAPK
jgi:hypothetical protein